MWDVPLPSHAHHTTGVFRVTACFRIEDHRYGVRLRLEAGRCVISISTDPAFSSEFTE